jgi:serralysin
MPRSPRSAASSIKARKAALNRHSTPMPATTSRCRSSAPTARRCSAGSTNLTAAGGIESLIDVSLPTAGTYFARITGSTANVQLYQLQLSASLALVTLVGDYNNDGRVDSLDYTLWRNTLGTGGSNLSADGNGNGRIDAGDFTVWKNHYGETSSGGGGIAGSVPEPSSMLLTLLALTALTPCRRRRLQ